MTDLARQIRAFALRALLAARGPISDAALRSAILAAFPAVAFTTGDLTGYLQDLEDFNYVAGTDDPIGGVMWDLTPKGKIKAQQLR